ncbi:NAD binding domain of 6-phosphogluconate dehydrogenase-domain-containing protein [Dipodascopsis tothii]|uniref:NAD binding domain of 6-phosphogluconate dehydrogenase-domain-containing protein n=1 Tax=Dipodascopsis tothii TaxID=44089 RepID=UPI0034CF56F7
MVQIAYFGLGNMGMGMACNIAAKAKLDAPLIVWNRSMDKTAAVVAKGAVASAGLADTVAKSDILFSCVSNDAAVNGLFDQFLAVPGGVAGKLFVESSTIHPDTTRALQKRVLAAGADFVAAPVFGAPAMAVAGLLVFVVAGSKAGIAASAPYMTGVMGRLVIDLSDDEDVGKALTLKIAGNTVILGMVESLSEGLTLAEKSGLGTDNFKKFIEALFGQSPYLPYCNRMMANDYIRDEPLFSSSLAQKDANHALSLARSSGMPTLPIIDVCNTHLDMVNKELGEKGDIASIYGAVRTTSGLPFSSK